MTEWKTIESAPMDGTEIIGWNGLEVTSFMWLNHADDEGHTGWACSGYEFGGILYSLHYLPSHPPTHWMPLPAPPKTDDEPQRFDEYGNYGENNPPLPMSSPSSKDYGC